MMGKGFTRPLIALATAYALALQVLFAGVFLSHGAAVAGSGGAFWANGALTADLCLTPDGLGHNPSSHESGCPCPGLCGAGLASPAVSAALADIVVWPRRIVFASRATPLLAQAEASLSARPRAPPTV
jgi:hypothetical protein